MCASTLYIISDIDLSLMIIKWCEILLSDWSYRFFNCNAVWRRLIFQIGLLRTPSVSRDMKCWIMICYQVVCCKITNKYSSCICYFLIRMNTDEIPVTHFKLVAKWNDEVVFFKKFYSTALINFIHYFTIYNFNFKIEIEQKHLYIMRSENSFGNSFENNIWINIFVFFANLFIYSCLNFSQQFFFQINK